MTDMIIKSKAIFDGVSDAPYAGAILVSGNRIADVIRLDGAGGGLPNGWQKAKVLDAGDRLVTAGFHDNHVHLLMAGMFREYANLIDCRSAEECAKAVYEFVKDDPDKDSWVIGFQWYHVFWDIPEFPTKDVLDRHFPDRPVFLLNAEAHGGWANSKALEICGVTRETPDPFGGEIVRGADGEPTGMLLENALALVTKHVLVFTPERERELIRSFMEGAKSYGITSITDVQPYFHGNMGDLAVYSQMDAAGELTVRIHAAPDLLGDLDEVERAHDAYASEKLRVSHVKQFMDGVFTTHTALVYDDYSDRPGERGISLFDTNAIAAAVPEAHRRGLSVKLHCLGDRANSMALDYFQKAIELHGKNACRHAIEHCELVAEKDIPRFGELGVVPSVQPDHMALTQTYEENPYPAALGEERAYNTWRLRDLLGSAGVMAIGSDCPVVDNNPFLEIYRAVTRVHNDGKPEGGLNPGQKLTLAEAIRGYTYGSAYSVGREAELGTLEPGKLADIIILDRNIFALPEKGILDAKVAATVFDGKVVYGGI